MQRRTQYPTDLNRPAEMDPDMWLDRLEADCLMYEQRQLPRKAQRRVFVTLSMRQLLINLRRRTGMTTTQAAKLLERSRNTVEDIEGGLIDSIPEDLFNHIYLSYLGILERGERPGSRVAAQPPGR